MELNMKTPIKKLILASGLTLTMLQMNNLAQADTLSQNMSEINKSAQIHTAYVLSPFLRHHNLGVAVQGDKATLTGAVEDEVNKDLAEQIALGLNGIKTVDNQITIDKDYVVPESAKERSFGQVVDDATITAAVKSKLLWSKYADGRSINVNTEYGKVTLKGTADSDLAKELADRLATNTEGVIDVDNQLKIEKAKSSEKDKAKKSEDTVGQMLSDSWITTKVKSTFMYSSNVNGSQISVSTEKGVVSLSGKLSNGAEKALAIEIAQNVRGVKSVVAKDLNG